MNTIRSFTAGGTHLKPINIEGTNRNVDTGLKIHVPKGEILQLGEITIDNVFIPIIKTGNGLFKFESITSSGFGGDGFNIRSNGQVVGKELHVLNHTPTRPYHLLYRLGDESIEDCLERNGETVYDPSLLAFELYKGVEVIMGYHVDAILQAYATPEVGYPAYDNYKAVAPDGDGYGVISNIHIPIITAKLSGHKSQGIMGSEKCRYTDIGLGTERLEIESDGYYFHTVFNTLDNSIIGCEGSQVTPGCKLKILDSKGSGKPIEGNQYPGFKPEDIIGDKPKMSTVSNTLQFTPIPKIDIRQWCFDRDVEVSKVEAIIAQESGYSKDAMLYERHIMYRELKAKGRDPDSIVGANPELKDLIKSVPFVKYGKYSEQPKRFKLMKEIDHSCAIKSCSWGFAQVMGFNWEMCGFLSEYDFEYAMGSEAGQMFAFLNYLENREGLLEAMRKGQTSRMKQLYNGPAIRDLDGDGMDDWEQGYIKHHNRILASQAPNRTVTNAISKSRTIKKQIESGLIKVVSSAGLAGLGLTLEQAEGILNSAAKVTQTARDKIEASKTQVDIIVDNISATVDTVVPSASMPSFSYMPNIAFCLAGIAIAGLFFNYTAILAYLEDNGFISPKAKFKDPTKNPQV